MLKILLPAFLFIILSPAAGAQDIAYRDSVDAVFKKSFKKLKKVKDRTPDSITVVYWLDKKSGVLKGAVSFGADGRQTTYGFIDGQFTWVKEIGPCGDKRVCRSRYYLRNEQLVHQEGDLPGDVDALKTSAQKIAARAKQL